MSLNKFSNSVIKEFLNVGCNVVNCNTLIASEIQIDEIKVDNLECKTLDVTEFAEILDANVSATLNANTLYISGIKAVNKISEPRVKTTLSFPTSSVEIQQLVNPYVAYTDNLKPSTVGNVYSTVYPNDFIQSEQSSVNLVLKTGDCYEFTAYLQVDQPTAVVNTTLFACFLNDVQINTAVSTPQMGAASFFKYVCRFSIQGANTSSGEVTATSEVLYSFIGSGGHLTNLIVSKTSSLNLVDITQAFSFKMINSVPFFITLQTASLACVYSTPVTLTV